MGEFITTDAESIYNTIITAFENNLEEPLYPGDERRLFVESALITIVVILFNQMDEAAKQRLLKYAKGPVLDALGERVNCTRLGKRPAATTLEFKLGAARTVDTVLPKGTRATADGTFYFAADESVIIRAGELTATVAATATVGGMAGNNFAIGAINTIVDAVPFVAGVTNLTLTSGGDNGEPYPEEDGGVGDDSYRERIKLAPATYSTAGAQEAYEYHTRSVSSQIKGVKVLSNQQAGKIDVYVVGQNGENLSDEIMTDIYEALNTRTRRPLGDLLTVNHPDPVSFDIELKYYVSKDNEAQVITNIEGAGGAIEQYINYQQEALGRDINPDKLRLLCLRPGDNLPGCHRVDIVKPVFTVLAEEQIAKHSGIIKITHEIDEG